MKYYVGIDIGGTNISTGVVDEAYQIVGRSKIKTQIGRSYKEILADVIETVRLAIADAKLEIDDIRWIKNLKLTDWVLGIFPQGTRQEPGKITNVTKGFASLAKTTKCNILPVGIIGTQEVHRFPFTGKIIVNIGEIIPYSDNVDDIVDNWGKSVEKLTGFEYIPNEE